MIKIEMHCHSVFSDDGFLTAEELSRQCRKKGIDCVCITDHNTIEGALKFVRQLPLKVIIGQEITTQTGEVIGLFIKKHIEPGLNLKETIEQIKAQGGLVFLPHPFDEYRDLAVKFDDAEKVKNNIDIIEVFNSRTFNSKYNNMALKFARDNKIAVAVGSDAHHRLEFANCYMQMEDFDSAAGFLKNLRSATYKTRKCPFILRLYIKALKILTGKK